jgi:hypothetical protein
MAKIANIAKSDFGKISSIDAPVTSSPFTFTMNTENAGSATKTFVLPLVSDGTINMVVAWGDGDEDTITSYNHADTTHVYSSTGTYTIQITGTIRGWKFAFGGDKAKILNISQWGDFNITQSYAFRGCANLTSNASDAPTIGTTDLSYTFDNCTSINGGTTGWDTSSVTNMYAAFKNASVFNQNLSSWNVANVENMYNMFQSCTQFTGAGTTGWNVAKVTNMQGMFYGATNFNADIGDWDTGECTTFYNMFRSPCAFNQDIGDWDTAKVETIGAMFRWNTTFNQDISGWNMAACTNMWGAFNYATAFEQNLGGWNIGVCTEFANFLGGVTLTTANYDALLIGWAGQSVQASQSPHFGGSTYTGGGTAAAARASLISDDSWTITDGGIA